ncbi:MAG: DUF4093 domain-containing protein [Eubacterium sp.]|nr:DUF4093 domain-containing protein [Eubacterium sp.]
MDEKLKLTQAVIVEGKYDKSKLYEVLDAFIIETNGFGIFKDKKRLAFIKQLAKERGVIILTDSDHAGFMIRNYISSGIPKENIINVFIPDIYGKEKRKATPSKEGKLGVEGMSREVLLKAFKSADISSQRSENPDPVTTYDLYENGFSGKPDSKKKKKALLKALELPEFLSTKALLTYINTTMTKKEFLKLCRNDETE